MSILVVGDAMVDQYWFGDIRRLSPEAPVPIVGVVRIEERKGAAANVYENVKAMGCNANYVFSPSTEKIVKRRLIARGQHVCRIDSDPPQAPITPQHFRAFYKDHDIVVFVDYGKGALANIEVLMQIAVNAGKTILVDPKGHDWKRYRGCTIIKPNPDEMRDMVGAWNTETELTAKAFQLRHSICADILLTRGADGLSIYDKDGAFHVENCRPTVVDVSGAGETALSAFAAALDKGYGNREAAQYANKAAALSVGRFGTAVIQEAEVFGA